MVFFCHPPIQQKFPSHQNFRMYAILHIWYILRRNVCRRTGNIRFSDALAASHQPYSWCLPCQNFWKKNKTKVSETQTLMAATNSIHGKDLSARTKFFFTPFYFLTLRHIVKYDKSVCYGSKFIIKVFFFKEGQNLQLGLWGKNFCSDLSCHKKSFVLYEKPALMVQTL